MNEDVVISSPIRYGKSKMRVDHSRNKTGNYAIIYNPLKVNPRYANAIAYLLVEVISRDKDGNVLRMKRNTVSSNDDKDELQRLIDRWESPQHQAMLNDFAAYLDREGLT